MDKEELRALARVSPQPSPQPEPSVGAGQVTHPQKQVELGMYVRSVLKEVTRFPPSSLHTQRERSLMHATLSKERYGNLLVVARRS